MKAGRLDRTITLFTPGDPVDDGYTTHPGEPENKGTRKAALISARTREIFENSGPEVERPVIFEVRSDPLTRQMTEVWTLEYEGRSYNIRSVAESSERRKFIRIEAVTGDENQG